MGENSIFLIDIDKVLRDKAGKKANRIPRFLVSYLKHIYFSRTDFSLR